ncbi:MAG: polysaccharide biosynthesis tyrosine autokinase [Anaerolineales bacterium]|nr:polysaccharide biosynthesis tyrosine autokinase [Anaerolineales bacterium]
MEIRQYLNLARKWAWLMILGLIIGGAGSYYYASRQPEVYQTSSRIMVSRAPEETTGNYYYIYNDLQLAKTYAQLIPAEPVLQAASEKLGYPVSGGQISVSQVPDSLLLDVSVRDSDPVRAAEIANSLINVFIDYNENLQKGRYASSEQSLQAQIAQVEAQITGIQTEMAQAAEQTQEIEKQQQEEANQQRLAELKTQLDQTEADIIKVEEELAAFYPLPEPTSTPVNRWQATATPVPTPTLSAEQLVAIKETQNRLDQLQTLRDLYKSTYTNLLVMGSGGSSTNSNSRMDQLQTTLALYQQIYSNLLNNYEAVRLARLRSTPNVVQVEAAQVPGSPVQPQPRRDAMLGAAIGLFLMAAIAFVVEYLDDTLKTPEDIDRHLHLPVIGLIGEMGRSKPKKRDKGSYYVYVSDNPLSPVTEAFRTLRTNLDFASVDKPLKTLLITSVGPSEGKSTLAVNLAVVMSQGDRKVVLMDTDLRRPSIHRYLQIPNRRGLTDVFRDQTKLSSIINSWGEPPIAIITSGGLPPNPTELISSEKMDRILTELKERTDIIILDSPPCIVADPLVLAAKVDGVMLVIEPGSTKIGAAQVLLEQLHRAGARVVGVVLNPISHRRGHYYSKYHYYASYYYTSRGYGQYYGSNGSNKQKRNGRPKSGEKTPETAAK